MYTINKPLKLTDKNNGQWITHSDGCNEFVSKEIAVGLLERLKVSNEQLRYLREKFGETGTGNAEISRNNIAIANAEK